MRRYLFLILAAISNCVIADVLFNDEYHFFNGASQSDIQAAIDSGKKKITLHSGEYTCTVTGVSPNQSCYRIRSSDVHVHLRTGAVIKLAPGQYSGQISEGSVIQIGDGATEYGNIIIDGTGEINGNETENTGTAVPIIDSAVIKVRGPVKSLKIKGITIDDGIGDCISIRGDAKNRAENVVIDGTTCKNSGEGIVIQNTNFIRVINNTLINMTEQDGIEPAGNTTNFIVSGNSVDGTSNLNDCIEVFDTADNGVVSNNTVSNCHGRGVQIGVDSPNVVTSNNVITATRLNGIRVRANGGVVIGNSIMDACTTGNNWCTGMLLEGYGVISIGNQVGD